MDEYLKIHAIITGVNEDGEDVLPEARGTEEYEEVIVDNGQRCPPVFAPPSPLNN